MHAHQVWQTCVEGDEYGIRWRVGTDTADIVSGLPCHAPDGGRAVVGHVALPANLLADGPEVTVMGLPDVLARWQELETQLFGAFRTLALARYEELEGFQEGEGDRTRQAAEDTAVLLASIGNNKYPADGPAARRWIQAFRAV